MYKLVFNYRNNQQLRESFNQLALKTFDLDFRNWYQYDYWNEDYIPYSFIKGNQVIANASITKLHIIINGKSYHAIQIGTVMTDEKYKKQGLARKLMEHILEKYKDACDFIYLFANETVLNFYPKFGFTRIDESVYCLDLEETGLASSISENIRKIMIEEDRALLEKFAKERYVNSQVLDVQDYSSLLLFYFSIPFHDMIYHIAELDTLVLMEEEGDTIHVFDIIALKKPDIKTIVANIQKETTKKVIFYFTIDENMTGLSVEKQSNDEDALFILAKEPLLNGHFLFPITSHT